MQKYRIWCRRNNEPDALWAEMSYSPRYLAECEHLVDYYYEQWGNLYQYEIVPVRFYPTGLREPMFV